LNAYRLQRSSAPSSTKSSTKSSIRKSANDPTKGSSLLGMVIALLLAGSLLVLTGCQALGGSKAQSGAVQLASTGLPFGSVVIGSSSTQSDTITNNTSSSVTVGSIQGMTSAFQISGITLPLVLAPGQNVPFNVVFQPAAAGNVSATISLNDANQQLIVSLTASGDGVTQGQAGNPGVLTPTPSPVSFGTIQVGSHQTTTVTLANTGGMDLTINQATLSGAGFSLANLALPITVSAGTSTTASVTFAPTGSGNFAGSVTFAITTNQTSSNVVLNLSGVGAGAVAGTLTPNPASLSFGTVDVGSSNRLTETLTNTGGSAVTITQATTSGAGFSISGLSLPVTVAVNQSVSFTAVFAPGSAGAVSGSLSIVSDASNSTLSIPLSGTGVMPGTLSANPSSLAFGTVQVGKSSSLSETLTNSGGTSLTISAATASGSGFSLSGLSLPLTLSAGQSTSFTVVFAPSATGAASGNATITSNGSNSSLSIALSGTGAAQGDLIANPASLAFGNVQDGTSKSLTDTLTNSGGTSLTISAASASGSGFSLSGLSLPLTLGAGQSTSFTVLFAPTATGAASGSVTITSNGSNSSLSIPLSGTGVTQGTLSANPTSLAFGTVQVGKSSSLSETLTNSGGSSLTISAAAASGSGYSLSGLSLPLTLSAGQSTSFTVAFAPTASGSSSGSVTITSNGSNSSLSIPLSGTGATPGTLSPNPSSLGFGSVQVGKSANLSETVTNTGGSSVTISQANVTGAAFSISGLSLPLSLAANQSVTFTATFTPSSTGAVSGSLAIVSDASNSTLTIALSGTGTAAGQLAVSPTSLSFGNVTVGSSSSLNGSLTASGASVTINSASSTNGEFVLSGISLPLTLNAGQSTGFTVTFTPQASGATSASLSFVSNASNSPTTQTMTGTGTTPTQHTVDLNWNAVSGVAGYNVYRGTASGGPYTMINSSLDGTTSYTDSTVVSGTTYYYVVTSVDSDQAESGYSNQAQAVVPNP
jgi:hypothetical protein